MEKAGASSQHGTPDGRRPTIRARLHPVLFQRLVRYCEGSGRSLSEVVRDGLERVLPPPDLDKLA